MAAQEPETTEGKNDIEKALDKIDEAVKAAEDCLKEADDQINEMIERRGRIATQVQHIWNLRHQIKRMIEEGKKPHDVMRLMRGY